MKFPWLAVLLAATLPFAGMAARGEDTVKSGMVEITLSTGEKVKVQLPEGWTLSESTSSVMGDHVFVTAQDGAWVNLELWFHKNWKSAAKKPAARKAVQGVYMTAAPGLESPSPETRRNYLNMKLKSGSGVYAVYKEVFSHSPMHTTYRMLLDGGFQTGGLEVSFHGGKFDSSPGAFDAVLKFLGEGITVEAAK